MFNYTHQKKFHKISNIEQPWWQWTKFLRQKLVGLPLLGPPCTGYVFAIVDLPAAGHRAFGSSVRRRLLSCECQRAGGNGVARPDGELMGGLALGQPGGDAQINPGDDGGLVRVV